jgi:CNT family concentrative nucleoside transporter
MQRSLGTSGAETLSASGNIFLGQTEAPLLIKPFVGRMTQSELITVMVGGFATVAGGVMAAYVAMLQDYFPSIAGHLLAASVMNAPAGLLLSKMLLPETGHPVTKDTLHVEVEKPRTSRPRQRRLHGFLALNVPAC